jgi:hypothetical protein
MSRNPLLIRDICDNDMTRLAWRPANNLANDGTIALKDRRTKEPEQGS